MLTLSGEGWSAFALLSSQFITPENRGLNNKDIITFSNGKASYDALKAKFVPQNSEQHFIFSTVKVITEGSLVVCIRFKTVTPNDSSRDLTTGDS